jgi:hypothetical protein
LEGHHRVHGGREVVNVDAVGYLPHFGVKARAVGVVQASEDLDRGDKVRERNPVRDADCDGKGLR